MKSKLLIAFLILSLAVAPVVGQVDSRDAQLIIRQPDWVNNNVETTSVDGQRAYVVEGSPIRLKAENFNSSNVADFGVETDVGSMSYDEGFDEYVFDPEGNEGTFEVYWSVAESRAVTQNNTTSVRTVQVRYSALIRVKGGVNVSHVPRHELEARQNATALGELMQDAIDDIRNDNLPLVRNSGTDLQIAQSMVNLYVNFGNPLRALTGNYTDIALILVTSLGGLLWVLQYLGLFAWMVRSLRGKLNRYNIIESEEGQLSDRIVEADEKERKQILQNIDWYDIFENDHVAYAFKEVFGETPHDGYQRLVNKLILPEVWMKERLLAMGNAGWKYVPAVGERKTYDLLPPGDEDELSMPMKQALENNDILNVIDWNDEDIRTFDLPSADIDTSAFDTTPTTMTLGELIDALDIQMSHFENEKIAGEYLREFIEFIKNHEYTDSEGRIDTSREMLNEFLKLSQLLGDRYGYPETHIISQSIERAIVDWNPSEDARTFVAEVESGRV